MTATIREARREVIRPRRALSVTIALAVAVLLLALVALGLGDYPLNPLEVVRAMFATDGGFATTIVLEWRLPRVLVALVFGAALGLSGALLQSLTRNPLGSPDIIGFSTGSYTGALLVITVLGSGYLSTAVGALLGGLLTALLVYLLAYRRGVQGFRLIIVGIAGYYQRFGYVSLDRYPIKVPFKVRAENCAIFSLCEDGIEGLSGTIEYAPEWMEA